MLISGQVVHDQVFIFVGQAEAILLAVKEGLAGGLSDSDVAGQERQQISQRQLAALRQRGQRGGPILQVT